MGKLDPVIGNQVLEALKKAIHDLKITTETDLRNASSALEGWTGPYGERFGGQDVPWMRSEAPRILDGMLKLQSAVRRAMDDGGKGH
jgi:hypothetical protein